jgi:myo-inositol 2-dehydrogenase / D-chiro-inositol 1-dehydrogenase
MPDCRIGFVGAGGVAARHARGLSMLPDVRLISVTDADPRRAQEFAATFRVRAVPDVRALLDSGVNSVYVCVPPFAHGRIETAIVDAGFAMFVEKPLGLNARVAGRIARAVTEAGIVTAVGHHWRYSATLHTASRLLAGRPVRLVCGGWLDKVPPVPWWTRLEKSGGQIIEQAVHVLDLARTLVGEVHEVHAMGSARRPGADIDCATAATLRFDGGAVGTFAATCQLAWKHRAGLEVYADELALTITEESLVVRDTHGVRRQTVNPELAKVAADRAFVEAVLGKRNSVLVPYAEALRTHRLACTLAASARLNRSIDVSHG